MRGTLPVMRFGPTDSPDQGWSLFSDRAPSAGSVNLKFDAAAALRSTISILNSRPAFTLLELLVATAVTIIMVGFLHVIFRTVSGTVTLGVATSDLIRANSDYTLQVANDSGAMIGPLNNGFIVILQKRLTGVALRPNDPATGEFRVDQVMWTRQIGGDSPPSPATPGSPNSYAEAASTAQQGRVWYGHVLRTGEDGTSADDLGVAGGTNEFAVRWVLGRQLLFLDANPSSSIHIDSSATYPAWNVVGYSSLPPALTQSWHTGLSDVFDRDLAGLRAYFGTATAPGVGYPAGPYQFVYGDDRLWCNPITPEGVDVEAWRVAQMHTYYIGNVSDFRVDFAGNYDGTGLTGSVNVSPIDGQIKWYSHFFNNETDGNWDGGPYDPSEPTSYRPPTLPIDLSGFLPADLTNQLTIAIYQESPIPNMPNADGAFTFRPEGLDWPKMIRFRYRVHDPQGQLADRDGLPGKVFERIIHVTTQ